MMMDEQQVLLALLSNALFQKPFPSFPDVDWETVYKEAKAQSVSPIVFRTAEKKLFSKETEAAWSEESAAVLAKNMRCNHAHGLIHQWMSDAGIPYVILKGLASAAYYPMPVLRTMGDVDFLVPLELLERAGSILEEKGLERGEEGHIAHIAYKNSNSDVELHFRIPGIPDGRPGELVKNYIKDIFEKASVQEVSGETIAIPAPFHHGLILLLHTCRHMSAEGIGLRHLCDWAVFENSFSDEVFRAMFEEKLKAIGLWKFAQILTQVCIQHLGADRKTWVGDYEPELVDGLIEDILSGGNFGRKEEERKNQGLLISSKAENGVGRTGMLQQFILSINRRLNRKWPVTKKNPLFLAAGWVVYVFHCAGMAITGKREVPQVDSMIHGARQRRDLYKELKLFES